MNECIEMKMFLIFVLCSVIYNVAGHARLYDPPSRSTMWRQGFRGSANYDDNQLYCGGFVRQWSKNGGKCGVCGDPWDGPRLNEAGGKYARGTITRRYKTGDTIDINVEVTANHKGWFEFRLCPTNNPLKRATHECMNRFPLQLADGTGVRRPIYTASGHVITKVKLPSNLQCSQCVLQWKYHAGNSWGVDANGNGCVGCGPQEEFYGCADIAISNENDTMTSPGDAGATADSQSTPSTSTLPMANAGINLPQQVPTPAYIDIFATPPNYLVAPVQPKVIPFNQALPFQIPGFPEKLTRVCLAGGLWFGQTTMDEWCTVNCNRGYCPEPMCGCY